MENFEIIYKENRVEIKDKQKIKENLIEKIGENNVSTDEIDILAYNIDALMVGKNWFLEKKLAGLPDIVTWPDTKEHVSAILKLANKEKIPVVPYAEGSGVMGGAIPIHGGIIIDMKKFNKIIEINDEDLTVTVEAGINGMNLERYLNSKGYTSGHIPQSLYISSLGGWIAHRAAGQFSTKYGKIEDIVIGMEIVLPQGEIINFKPIMRAATGPQLDKFFMGNEGTLGIVTKATLRIWPKPEKRTLISYAFPTFEDSLNAVRQILREQIYPAVVRIYDADETFRHFPDVEKANDKVMTIFVCEGNESLVNLEETVTREKCEKNSGIDCGIHPVEHWFETRFRVTETSASPPNKITFDTIEVSVSWKNAGKLYHKAIEAAKKVKGLLLCTAHVSHFYPNGVGMYFSFGGVEVGEQTNYEFYQEVWNKVMETVLEAGGSIAHHHGIGINRSHWMDKEWGKSMKVLREFKKVLDPNNILNPGKVYMSIWKGGEI